MGRHLCVANSNGIPFEEGGIGFPLSNNLSFWDVLASRT